MGAGFEGSAAKFPAWCPQSDVRLFIGITSRCASAEVNKLASLEIATQGQGGPQLL